MSGVTRYKSIYGTAAHAARDLLVRGTSPLDIVRRLLEDGFSQDEVWDAIPQGQALIVDEGEAFSDPVYQNALELLRYEASYRQSMGEGDNRAAIVANEKGSEARRRIYPESKNLADPSGRPYAGLSSEDLNARIDQLTLQREAWKKEEALALPPSPIQDPEPFNPQIDRKVPAAMPVNWPDYESDLPTLSHPLDEAIESAPLLGGGEIEEEEEERMVMEF